MRKNMAIFSALAALLTVSALGGSAHAQTWLFGARVGGYGFRQVTPSGETTWNDCRMDGSGIFAQRNLTRYAFVETGLDLYQSRGDEVVSEGMERTSTHATVAGGLRMFPGRRVSPYIQLGLGAEYTDVHMAEHQTRLLPSGFFGIGAELRITKHLRGGMNLRVHMMGHFDHEEPGTAAAAGTMHEHEDMGVEAAPATQGQFFLSYEM